MPAGQPAPLHHYHHDGKYVKAMEADKKRFKTRRLDVSWAFGMFFEILFDIWILIMILTTFLGYYLNSETDDDGRRQLASQPQVTTIATTQRQRRRGDGSR